jgi:hypothetical protein
MDELWSDCSVRFEGPERCDATRPVVSSVRPHYSWSYAVDATNCRESIGPHFSGILFLQSYVLKT